MKKNTPFFITLLLMFSFQFAVSQGLVINEILSANTTVNADEDGSRQDWVELYNGTASTISLNGFGLSDDALLPFKWVFPNVSMAPGSYLLVWCSDKNRAVAGSELHTNFKLSSAGDVVILSNTSLVTVDFVPATTILQNVSYGRSPNGTGPFLFYADVTPGAANGSVAYSEALVPPTFSQTSGFYTNSISLTLTTTVPGATILYTLDGSEPKQSNLGGTTYSYKNVYPELPGQATGPLLSKNFTTLQYSTPLTIVDRSIQPNKIASISTTYANDPYFIPATNIFKGTVVRAKLIKPGSLESKTVTNSYYISPQGINRFPIPVISFSLNENKLFDYNNGIYVAGVDFDNWRIANPTFEPYGFEGEGLANYFRLGIATENAANMTYFVNGVEVLNQDVGIRVRGASSRDFPSKSLNIYARSDYGDDTMSYKFFDDQPFDSFGGIILRNSGNDFNQTMFRDAFCHSIIKGLNVVTKGYQPTASFINGEYWGLINLRDKIDTDFFNRRFNIGSNQVDFLENQGAINAGDDVHYWNMINYIEANSLAPQANYNYIKTQLDPDSFNDYQISNILFENNDWPGNNIFYFRKKTAAYEPNAPFPQDGRWRWIAHDMDDCFAISSSRDANYDSLAAATDPNGPEAPNPAWSTLMLRRMLENNGFKYEFITRFADLLNTSFTKERMLAQMLAMKAVIAPLMPQQFARWKMPLNNGDWNYFLNLQTEFINERVPFQRDHIRTKFGIASNINVVLNVSDANQGYIKINTIEIKNGTPSIAANPYPWTGIYFSNIPVKLKAIAKPGFVFSHWSGASTSTDAEITLSSATGFNVTAIFEVESVAASRPIYFWLMDSNISNNIPLESLTSTYKVGTTDGIIQYKSCLVGYPFTSADPNWRKASMERRNSPTELNYLPETNNNIPFNTSNMRGIQIKEPLQNGGLENAMSFNFSTLGFKEIIFSFAGFNELTNATGILVDYSTNSGASWSTANLSATNLPFTAGYKLFDIDFSLVTVANNTSDFRIRLRFTGTNMTADNGARITFNNIAVFGKPVTLSVAENDTTLFNVFPNPFTDVISVVGINQMQAVSYKLFSMEGRLIKKGMLENSQAHLAEIPVGIYMLQLSSAGKIETKKIVKE